MFHKDLYLLHFFYLCPAHRNLFRSPLLHALHAVGLCEPWLGGVVRVAGVHSRTGAGVSVMMSSRTSSSASARSVSRLRARCCNNQRDVILLLTHFQTDKSDRNNEHAEEDPASTFDKMQKLSGVQMQQHTAPT